MKQSMAFAGVKAYCQITWKQHFINGLSKPGVADTVGSLQRKSEMGVLLEFCKTVLEKESWG